MKNKNKFTLIESLVVLTITASFIGMLFLAFLAIKGGMEIHKQGLKPTFERIWNGK